MDWYEPKFKSNETIENCNECGVCYYICPQTEPLIKLLDEQYSVKDKIGNIENVIAAKTTQEKIEEIGQDGGIVTTSLVYLFEKNLIDAAIVSLYDEELKPEPHIIFDKEELFKAAGTRYSISSQILPLKELYNLSLEIQEEKGIYDIDQLRIAFVGTPCQARAIRKMQYLSIKPAHVIKYLFSLFCFENFDYYKLYEILEKETNVPAENIKKTTIKKNFFVYTKQDEKHEVNIKKLDPAVRNHCHSCDEFTGRYADISVGSSGAPKGYSMIITRTSIGQDIVNLLLSSNYISQYIVPVNERQEWKQKKMNLFNRMVKLKK
ncbi:MAG: hypothetical protein GF317_23865 [Candidatus Lokiarchaeota archaeon]|nr:hypothetical protein [Candidatus Lokiarchaeota archaeon]MBD3202410.1 hypothetical protein [Candidatus Lokiarchaeota archaeon]